ncbi:MAG: hypothetical protein EBQ92_13515 [Proteobacteria bacterium]|nr:hypothetical protein [Pseudomonadota bacterium]
MVSIFGSGFQNGATVTIGGSTCTNPIWQSYNELLCTLPSGSSGSATVVVTNPGGANGSSNSSFSYVVPPDPSGLTATVDHSTQITLSWSSGGGTTSTFQVAYQTGSTAPADCSSGTVVSYSTIGSSTSAAITVSSATDYTFRVCARDGYGQFSSGVTATATTGWVQEAYLKAPNADSSDQFGRSTAVSGDTIVVGSPQEASNQTTITNGTTASSNNSLTNSGAAYVFKRASNAWTQEAYLKASNADSTDYFGYSTAVSGDTIVVGAYGEASNQTTITNGTTASSNNSLSSSGAAYVFKRTNNTWAQEAYLKAPNADSSDYFGVSTAVSGDTIVVGAYREYSNQTTITNGTTASSNNTLGDSGAAYVFKRTNTTWAQEAYLKAPNAGSGDRFGFSTAVSGDTIVVGAHLEASNQTTITNGTTASSNNSLSSSGAAYVFKRTNTTWAQEAYLKAPNADSNDFFGISTAVSGDTIVVGAYGEASNQTTITNGTTASSNNSLSSSGTAYVFRRPETIATPVVSSVTPSSGVVSGNTVVIFGSGFRKDAAVTIGGAACTSKTVQSPNEIICTLPTNSAGAKAIQVTNPDASTSNTSVTVTY